MLESMLEFNPNNRQTAGELINHKAFDSIRVEDNEKGAPYKIHLDIDYY